MHDAAPDPDEPIYVISVAARMVELHPQTLRHYEKVGLVQPARSSGGTRMYSMRDIERLRRISSLVEDLGVNLAGVEVILKMSRQIEELQAQLREMERALGIEVERARRAVLQDDRARQRQLPEPDEGSTS